MFACAVVHRQEKVAQFLHENVASNDTNMVTTIDEDGNNILHLAAKLAPHSQLDHICGAALWLQNELHWFKSVEGIVPQYFQSQKNKDGETPTQLFVREHRHLLKEAEAWMKKVAESCTVVGALVITILFAAAFIVPGGNNEKTGLPIFLKNETDSPPTASITPPPTTSITPPPAAPITVVPFMVFAISDAIALFAASSSVLINDDGILRYSIPNAA
ncbi:hypothetical protein SLEP1_g54652 [Rubroshorea leprosula]|uniref:PGG domain-containing protein n=1 Tax=Rubroshorea leprosula TaxID=152421 RepID=A0AAV5ME32_9ROSI|nr:hypothetical protein SLEP1_g54652 [Rubroshorea leprosula]